jgi:hypothetical protein
MGEDTNDKAIAKALTSAVKYALLKTFLITDEPMVDPDSSGAPKKEKKQHSPHREEKSDKEAPNAKADLATLRGWMEDNGIAESFVMKLAAEGKLAASETKLEELKPGSITRLLGLRKRIEERYLEAQGGQKSVPSKSTARQGKAREMAENSERDPHDQRPASETPRKAAQSTIVPRKYLELEGFDGWRKVSIHFGTKKDTELGTLADEGKLSWWITDWFPKPYKGKFSDEDLLLDAALCIAQEELS